MTPGEKRMHDETVILLNDEIQRLSAENRAAFYQNALNVITSTEQENRILSCENESLQRIVEGAAKCNESLLCEGKIMEDALEHLGALHISDLDTIRGLLGAVHVIANEALADVSVSEGLAPSIKKTEIPAEATQGKTVDWSKVPGAKDFD